jgi:hypothetical protein
MEINICVHAITTSKTSASNHAKSQNRYRPGAFPAKIALEESTMSIKRITCQRGMDELARTLEEYGYELVPQGKPCDAFVYNGNLGMLEAITGTSDGLPGTLVVNAKGLSPQQVALILRKGSYSPLF